MQTAESGNGLKSLFELMLRYPRRLAGILGLALLASAIAAPSPYLGKIIIDELIFKGGSSSQSGPVTGWMGIPQTLLMLGAVVLLGVSLKLLASVVTGWQSHEILQITRNALYELRLETALKLMGAPQKFFETTAASKLASRLVHDINQMDAACFIILRNLVSSAFLILTIVVFMLWMNVWLTLVILVTMPVTALCSIYSHRRLREFSLEESDRVADLTAVTTETFAGMKIIRAFGAESYFLKRMQDRCEQLRFKGIYHWTVQHMLNSLLVLVSGLGADIFLILGGVLAFRGQITFGEFFAFYSYQAMLWGPIGTLLNAGSVFQTGVASAEKVEVLRHMEQEPYLDKETVQRSDPFRGEIVCENLRFHYHEDEPVLQDINLTLKPGTMTALVGQTGSGKTTLAHLFMGAHLPTAGRLVVDGIEIRQWDLRALRSNVGVVLQDHLLFDDTIRANLVLGRDDLTDDRIWASLRAAHLDDFIERLPDQLNTRVGVSGARLSGGQKQRIAIARVFLRNPKLIILDEATSALDTETEKAIQRSFDALMVGRTSVVIAHRLSTIYEADQILVLHQGRLVECGTHQELVGKPAGHYRDLYEAQVEGMIPMSGATRRPPGKTSL